MLDLGFSELFKAKLFRFFECSKPLLLLVILLHSLLFQILPSLSCNDGLVRQHSSINHSCAVDELAATRENTDDIDVAVARRPNPELIFYTKKLVEVVSFIIFVDDQALGAVLHYSVTSDTRQNEYLPFRCLFLCFF